MSSSISIHSLRGEGDGSKTFYNRFYFYFNPLPPWGGRLYFFSFQISIVAFQSTPSVGRETCSPRQYLSLQAFQSTPSVGRETTLQRTLYKFFVFQSTPSVGRETPFLTCICLLNLISIHSLRGEGDPEGSFGFKSGGISIHSLRGEGDAYCIFNAYRFSIFQSTPSVGRETQQLLPEGLKPSYFNPLPPWGGRQQNSTNLWLVLRVPFLKMPVFFY